MSSGPWKKAKKPRWLQNFEYKLQSRYGITVEDYNQLLEKQNHHCALCPTTPEENGERLSVDHCHITFKIRGLLCRRCNALVEKIYPTHPQYPIINQYLERI